MSTVQDWGSEPSWFCVIYVKNTVHRSFTATWLISCLSFSFRCRLLMTLVISEMSCRTSLVKADGVGHSVWDCFWLSLTLHRAAPQNPRWVFLSNHTGHFLKKGDLGGKKSYHAHKACEGSDYFMMSYSAQSKSLTEESAVSKLGRSYRCRSAFALFALRVEI